MNVLAIIHDAYGGKGGIAKFNSDFLSSLLVDSSVQSVTCLARSDVLDASAWPRMIRATNRFHRNPLLFSLHGLLYTAKMPRIDLVISGHINFSPLAMACSKLLRARSLLIVHGIDAWSPPNGYLTARVSRGFTRVVSVSDFTRSRFCEWSGMQREHVHVVPNCVDADRFRPKPPSPDLIARYGLQGRRVLMTMSRLAAHERYKGVDEIIELMPRLVQQEPELAYLVCGDGDDRPRLQEKAHAAGVGERVVFAGYVPEAEKADHFALANAFLLAGWGEGFGIVLLEALASGVPVVASVLDASQEAVMNGALGELVDPKNPDDLEAGILRALTRPTGQVPDDLDYFSEEKFRRRFNAAAKDAVEADTR